MISEFAYCESIGPTASLIGHFVLLLLQKRGEGLRQAQ